MASFTCSIDDTLLVFALEEEAQGCFDCYRKVFTGVGKVNAAYRLMCELAAWKAEHGEYPKLVLNLGSAGSGLFPKGTVVNCTQFIQRDMDVSVFGHALFTTPRESLSPVFSAGIRVEDLPQGVCGSGDSFVTDGVMRGWNVVDMEAYAFAKVCVGQGVPFCCLKYISDGANDEAVGSWSDALAATARTLQEVVARVVTKE